MKKLIYLFAILCLCISCVDHIEYQPPNIVYYKYTPSSIYIKPHYVPHKIIIPHHVYNQPRAYKHRHRH